MTEQEEDPTRSYFEAKCELRPLPIELPEHKVTMHYHDNRLCVNGDPVELICIGSFDPDPLYTPFYTRSHPLWPKDWRIDHRPSHERDNIMLMPVYDKPGLVAFMANRYAWGMNIGYCYLDIANKKVYMHGFFNHDHPECIALRKTQDGRETDVFLYYGDHFDGDLIEEDKNGIIHSDDDLCSGWWRNWVRAESEFNQLQSCIELLTIE